MRLCLTFLLMISSAFTSDVTLLKSFKGDEVDKLIEYIYPKGKDDIYVINELYSLYFGGIKTERVLIGFKSYSRNTYEVAIDYKKKTLRNGKRYTLHDGKVQILGLGRRAKESDDPNTIIAEFFLKVRIGTKTYTIKKGETERLVVDEAYSFYTYKPKQEYLLRKEGESFYLGKERDHPERTMTLESIKKLERANYSSPFYSFVFSDSSVKAMKYHIRGKKGTGYYWTPKELSDKDFDRRLNEHLFKHYSLEKIERFDVLEIFIQGSRYYKIRAVERVSMKNNEFIKRRELMTLYKTKYMISRNTIRYEGAGFYVMVADKEGSFSEERKFLVDEALSEKDIISIYRQLEKLPKEVERVAYNYGRAKKILKVLISGLYALETVSNSKGLHERLHNRLGYDTMIRFNDVKEGDVLARFSDHDQEGYRLCLLRKRNEEWFVIKVISEFSMVIP